MDKSTIQRVTGPGDPVATEEGIKEIDGRLQSSTDAREKACLLLDKAVLSGILRRFDDSREQLDLALAQAPNDPDIRLQFDFIRATLYDHEGDTRQAFAQLTRVLSDHRERLARPDLRFMYEDVQLRRGLDAARNGELREATPLLQESLSFNLGPEEKSAVLANLGVCYTLELKNYESARDCFIEARRVGLTKEWEGQVHFYLGMSYAYLKLFREAKREFQVCEERIAECGFPAEKIYGWLSWVCKGLGEVTESEGYARMARPT